MDDVGYLAREQEALSPKLIVKLEVKELACMKESERNSKANHARKHHLRCVKQIAKQKSGQKVGGSEWVSNPPWTLEVPINGFEVREAHRSSLAPSQPCGRPLGWRLLAWPRYPRSQNPKQV